jgi:branched-chain amino acid transport system substrate-binding protein
MSGALPTMTSRRAVVLAVALLVAACASPPQGSTRAAQIPPDRLIRIATQTPLSGGQASLGESIRLAVELAVEKHRAPLERAGFAVEVVAMDDQARPDVGVANARRLVADRPSCWSSGT